MPDSTNEGDPIGPGMHTYLMETGQLEHEKLDMRASMGWQDNTLKCLNKEEARGEECS